MQTATQTATTRVGQDVGKPALRFTIYTINRPLLLLGAAQLTLQSYIDIAVATGCTVTPKHLLGIGRQLGDIVEKLSFHPPVASVYPPPR